MRYLSYETLKADAIRQRRNRGKKTDEQHQKQHQQDAKAHQQQHINNPQLHKFAQDFSEDANVPILHQINVTSSSFYHRIGQLLPEPGSQTSLFADVCLGYST
nr:4910_t:CDS:2 [Entrophospora candida]